METGPKQWITLDLIPHLFVLFRGIPILLHRVIPTGRFIIITQGPHGIEELFMPPHKIRQDPIHIHPEPHCGKLIECRHI
jgi:hypothetical protein